MNVVASFLNPVPGPQPCGADVSRDPRFSPQFFQLRDLIKRNEGADGEVIEPDWRKVHELSLELLKETRDLNVAVIYCLAALKLEGLAGFGEGLNLLQGFIEKFWDHVYPLLDADTKSGRRRINVLNSLSTPIATDTPYRFLKFLHLAPLFQSARGARFTLYDVQVANGNPAPPEFANKPPATLDQLRAAAKDTGAEALNALLGTITGSLASLQAIEKVFASQAADGETPNFNVVRETLEKLQSALALGLDGQPAQPSVAQAVAQPGAGTPRAAEGWTGNISSREDVVRCLKAIREYYASREPSSPVPFLIERALRMVNMNYMEILQELHSGSVENLVPILGVKDEKNEKNNS